jgi:hypothetical protein
MSRLTVGSNPIALKSEVHAETRRTRRYNLLINWLQAQAQTHADKLMPTRSIMNIENLDFYFWGGCVLFSAFSAPPRETFQIKIPVSTGNYDRA